MANIHRAGGRQWHGQRLLVYGIPPEGVGKGTTAMQNRDRKLVRVRVRVGSARAALVFEGDDCLSRCDLGSAEELPRI